MRYLAVLLAVLLSAACVLRRQAHYVQIADALTSPTLREGIRVAPQRFTLTSWMRVCPDGRVVDRFTTTGSLRLQVGERFPLGLLSIVAIDAEDRALPDIPVSIEVDERRPPVLLLRSEEPAVQENLVALRPGGFRLRIQTLCGRRAATTITGRVRVPPRVLSVFGPPF